jgi:hypothetical protein
VSRVCGLELGDGLLRCLVFGRLVRIQMTNSLAETGMLVNVNAVATAAMVFLPVSWVPPSGVAGCHSGGIADVLHRLQDSLRVEDALQPAFTEDLRLRLLNRM